MFFLKNVPLRRGLLVFLAEWLAPPISSAMCSGNARGGGILLDF